MATPSERNQQALIKSIDNLARRMKEDTESRDRAMRMIRDSADRMTRALKPLSEAHKTDISEAEDPKQ